MLPFGFKLKFQSIKNNIGTQIVAEYEKRAKHISPDLRGKMQKQYPAFFSGMGGIVSPDTLIIVI